MHNGASIFWGRRLKKEKYLLSSYKKIKQKKKKIADAEKNDNGTKNSIIVALQVVKRHEEHKR